MTRTITPTGPVHATIHVPGSKSITNRALICAALAMGDSVIRNASDSDDTALMCNGLNQLGVLVRKTGEGLVVSGTGGRLFAPKFPIPVGNAGTTLRFLLSLSALAEGKTTFESDIRMADRPNDELLDALRELGCNAQQFGTRYVVNGGGLKGGTAKLTAERSSQFLSSLLMTASYAREAVQIEVNGTLSSAPYVNMTIEVMKEFGVHAIANGQRGFSVQSGQYTATEFNVEPDASGASYFLAAAAIAGGEVSVDGLKDDSLQGDIKFVDVLENMGCTVEKLDSGIRVRGAERLRGVNVDMNAMPDVVLTLAVTALFADGPTRIRNVGQLRYKESDRMEALATELQKLGASVAQRQDGFEILPGSLHGAQLDTRNDHRLAMSFALVGLKVPGVMIENPECVKKSFPTFWGEFERLYSVTQRR